MRPSVASLFSRAEEHHLCVWLLEGFVDLVTIVKHPCAKQHVDELSASRLNDYRLVFLRSVNIDTIEVCVEVTLAPYY